MTHPTFPDPTDPKIATTLDLTDATRKQLATLFAGTRLDL